MSHTVPLKLPHWPPDWPEIAESVNQTLRSGQWGNYRGPAGAQLTSEIAVLCNTQHARLVSSGSIGIEVALRASGIGPGDGVLLCGYDYPGNLRGVELLSARPILADAGIDRFSIDADAIAKFPAKDASAVIVSHLYGVPADVPALRDICDEKGWRLIEDACQVPGMQIEGRPAGCWGDIGVLSFGGSKPLTAGNGGAVVSNDDRIASKWAQWLDRPSDSVPMCELQSAALLPQLGRLAECNATRWETVQAIRSDRDAAAARLDGWLHLSSESTFYKLAMRCENRDAVLAAARSVGLPMGKGYRSMHRTSDRRCQKIGNLSRCQQLAEQLVLLDHSALLSVGRGRESMLERLKALPGTRTSS